MAEKIGLWVGFSIHVGHKKDAEEKLMYLTLKGKGTSTTSPETAWADALRIGQENQKHLKDDGYQITVDELGIQPAHFA